MFFDLVELLEAYSSPLRLIVETILCIFVIECFRKYLWAPRLAIHRDLEPLYYLYTVYYAVVFVLFAHHPLVRFFFETGMIDNPCLVVKPVLFIVASITFYFHLIAAIDWLELASNGYQLVEINQRPVVAILIGISIIEGMNSLH